jgi:molybdopterin synthase catalytic subunit/molybdopterin converting factor small subunit
MDVHVRCFALLRELSADRTQLSLADGATIENAWAELARRHPALVPHRPFVRAARNGAYAAWEEPLTEQDEIAFLPPVSGGGGVTHTAISEGPIDESAVASGLAGDAHGAVVSFVGRARNRADDGREVLELEYEAYGPMAEPVLEEIAAEAADRWDASVGIVHRIGRVPIGEASVVIVTAAAHRDAAYQASRYVIEAIKERLPIWKRERFTDGSEWKRPGA